MLPFYRLLVLCLLPIPLLTANENESVEEVVEEAIELRTSIYEIVETFTSDIAFIISSESFRNETPESRRRMLAWALRTVPYSRSICYDNSADVSLVDFGITLGWLDTQLQRKEAESAL